MRRISIPTRLFGLNKLDVSEYLDNLSKDNSKVLEELEKEFEQLKKEHEKLKAQLAEAKKEEVRYEDEIVEERQSTDDKAVEEAYKRLEKTVALINMVADEESSQLVSGANKKLDEYDKIIENLQDDINEKKKRIESLLSNVLGILKANVENVTSKMKEKESVQKPPNVLRESLSHYLDEDEMEVTQFAEKEEERGEKITADGTSLTSIPKLLMFQNKYGSKAKDDNKKREEDRLLTQDEFEEFAINNELDFEEEPKLGFDKWYDDIPDEFGEAIEQAINEAENQPKQEEESSDIKKMRNTLIIGKIAGEDIVDSENNIIIPKGKVLAEEDVAIAERESKLAELIINMSLPK